MLRDLLEGLTKEQKAELELLSIPQPRLSEWKNGKRKPTAAQLMVLATITKRDPLPLLYWLAEQEANPAQRDLFRMAKEAGRWAALTVVLTAGISGHERAFALMNTSENGNHQGGDRVHIVDILKALRGLFLKLSTGRTRGLFFAPSQPKETGC